MLPAPTHRTTPHRIVIAPPPSPQTILDQSGAKTPRCCLLRNGLLVVARSEGLYDYTLDTRAGCTVFEGPKQQLIMLRRFLVVVCVCVCVGGVHSL